MNAHIGSVGSGKAAMVMMSIFCHWWEGVFFIPIYFFFTSVVLDKRTFEKARSTTLEISEVQTYTLELGWVYQTR